jgi:hypothetical protein
MIQDLLEYIDGKSKYVLREVVHVVPAQACDMESGTRAGSSRYHLRHNWNMGAWTRIGKRMLQPYATKWHRMDLRQVREVSIAPVLGHSSLRTSE